MKNLAIFFAISMFFLAATAQHKVYYPDPHPGIEARLDEWQDLKFGLLMHWGPYSQWGIVESWSICPEDVGWAAWGRKEGVAEDYFDYLKRYEALQTTFNPIRFEPERWASAAKQAGMKYVIFTTKHHDGFCMFDTEFSDYKITGPTTPFSTHPRRNVTAEIFNAFRAEDFWVGAYFSKPDWHSVFYWWPHFPPADRNVNYSVEKYPERWQKFVEYTHNQIDELMSDYGKIDILWLDGGWVRPKNEAELHREMFAEHEGVRYVRNPQNQDINMAEIVRKARKKQPGLLVVDREVPGVYQNYLTPEQYIPDEGLPYPWETCMTMASSWSYVPGDDYKTAEDLIKKLVDVVSKGGNFLLNIGPAPNGSFDPVAYDRLEKIGQWMEVNGESIYETRLCKTVSLDEKIRFTQSKDGKIRYVFLFEYPEQYLLIEDEEGRKTSRVTLLSNEQDMGFIKKENSLEISFPAGMKESGEHVWVLKIQ